MNHFIAFPFVFSSNLEQAISSSLPLVALESTVITHGLPYPQNLELAFEMERIIRENGASPATIAVLDGIIHIGLADNEKVRLAKLDKVRKISRRDLPTAILNKEC